MKDTVLFGASKLGEVALALLQSTYNITGFIDNDEKKWGTKINGLPVYAPIFIQENDVKVIITSSYVNEIKAQLQKMDFWNYRIFNIGLQSPSSLNSTVMNHTLPTISVGKLLQDVGAPIAINDVTFLSGGSSIMDYIFLKAIMQKCNFCTYLEIGTWTGESISAVAEVAEMCYSISLPDDNKDLIMTFKNYCNKDNFSRFFSNGKDNIIHFYGDSLTFDYEQINEKIDLVFIDGDHSYDAIKTDTQNIFNLVGFDDSILVWHDFKTVRNQLVESTYKAIKAVLPEEYEKNLFAVSNNICGIYIPKKLQKYFSFENNTQSLYSYKVSLTPILNHL